MPLMSFIWVGFKLVVKCAQCGKENAFKNVFLKFGANTFESPFHEARRTHCS